MLGAALWVWRFLRSPLGLALMGIVAALVTLGLWGHQRYSDGVVVGRAEVQKTIDAPATGWRARLEGCERNTTTLRQVIDENNARARAQSLEADAKLAVTTKALAGAQAATRTARTNAVTILAPLTAPDTCSRVLEADRRLLDSLP